MKLPRAPSWLLGPAGALGSALHPAAAWACAVCMSLTKEDLGLFWSAVFIMAVPFGVAGLIGGWLYYSHRRSAGRRQSEAGRPAPTSTEKESRA